MLAKRKGKAFWRAGLAPLMRSESRPFSELPSEAAASGIGQQVISEAIATVTEPEAGAGLRWSGSLPLALLCIDSACPPFSRNDSELKLVYMIYREARRHLLFRSGSRGSTRGTTSFPSREAASRHQRKSVRSRWEHLSPGTRSDRRFRR